VVRVHGTMKALAITTDCTPRYCFADPVEGGKQAVAETWRNLIAVGAKPLAITDCMNFGAPTRPEIMGQFVGCIEGMAAACTALDFPVVSGNVSLYNETNGVGILPTPAIGGVGLIADYGCRMTLAFKAADEAIWLVGEPGNHLGQSLWLRDLLGREDGPPPPVDLAAERAAGEAVAAMITARQVTAVHDVSGGGVAVGLARMALAGGIGATLTPGALTTAAAAFGEGQGRYIVTTVGDTAPSVSVPVQRIGTTGGATVAGVPLDALRAANEGALPAMLKGEL
jgi:phosphoribosylformylglycinamidine synthase